MKKEKINKITEFEETCMWMSYRYAIGRSSIASVMHANDIAQNLFYKIPNDRKEFTSFDIARSIDDILRWKFDFYVTYPNVNKNYCPFELLMKFIKENNIHDLDDFNKYKSIYVNSQNKEFEVKYNKLIVDSYHSSPDGYEQEDIYERKWKNYNISDIEDLLPWQKLSACFDIHNLKVVKTLYEGKEEEFICFKTYFKEYARKMEKNYSNNDYHEINDLHNITWYEHWMSIDNYISGRDNMYLDDEYIISVRDITEEECKKFEGYK